MRNLKKYAAWLLALIGLPAFLAAQTDCLPVPTGENATIILPVAATPLLDGAPLPEGTEIQVGALRNGEWFCAGSVTWEEENTALIAYGEDDFTEGLQTGEPYRFRALLPDGCLADSISVSYENAPGYQAGAYQNDGISLVSSLKAYSLKAEAVVRAASCPELNNGEAAIEISIPGTPPYSYNWSGGQNAAVTGNLQAGPFSVTITDANGCRDTAAGTIGTAPLPVVQLPPDTVLCNADTLTLTPLLLNADSLLWSTGHTAATILVDMSGTYLLTAFSAEGCQISDSIQVAISSLPASFLADSTLWCNEDSLLLEATTAAGLYSYEWSNGSNEHFTWVFTPGDYTLTITDELGCTREDAVLLTTTPPLELALLAFPTPACPGDTVEIVAMGGESAQWFYQDDVIQASEEENMIRLVARDSFEITAIASNNCFSDTASLLIPVFPFEGGAGPDTCLLAGQSALLYAYGGVSYFWESDNYEIDNPTDDTIRVAPTDSTLFRAIISDATGCFYLDSVEVLVVENPLAALPPISAISPNDDGKNDVLEFPGLEKFPQNELIIFNRWGTVVFQKRGYQSDAIRWDGTYRSKELPVGVYYYVLSIGEVEMKQTISVIR